MPYFRNSQFLRQLASQGIPSNLSCIYQGILPYTTQHIQSTISACLLRPLLTQVVVSKMPPCIRTRYTQGKALATAAPSSSSQSTSSASRSRRRPPKQYKSIERVNSNNDISLDTSSSTKEEGRLLAPANGIDLAASTASTSSQATSSALGSYPCKPKEPEVPKTTKKANANSSTTLSSNSSDKDYQPPTSTQYIAQYATSSLAIISNNKRSGGSRYFNIDNSTLGYLEVF